MSNKNSQSIPEQDNLSDQTPEPQDQSQPQQPQQPEQAGASQGDLHQLVMNLQNTVLLQQQQLANLSNTNAVTAVPAKPAIVDQPMVKVRIWKVSSFGMNTAPQMVPGTEETKEFTAERWEQLTRKELDTQNREMKNYFEVNGYDYEILEDGRL